MVYSKFQMNWINLHTMSMGGKQQLAVMSYWILKYGYPKVHKYCKRRCESVVNTGICSMPGRSLYEFAVISKTGTTSIPEAPVNHTVERVLVCKIQEMVIMSLVLSVETDWGTIFEALGTAWYLYKFNLTKGKSELHVVVSNSTHNVNAFVSQ